MNPVERVIARLFPVEGRQFVIDSIPRGSVCCEVGVWKGDFAERILKTAKPAKLYLIDPWLYEADPVYDQALYGKRAGSQGDMDRIHREVSARFAEGVRRGVVEILRETSNSAAKRLKDGELDWVYIDANHTYEYCRRDIQAFTAKLKPGGWMVLDDYSTSGWWGDGVIRAAEEAAREGRLEKVRVRNGQCVLRKVRP